MKPLCICKKCGNLFYDQSNGQSQKKCTYCNEIMESFFIDVELDVKIGNKTESELDVYRLQYQPYENYDIAAWTHREHMENSRKKTGSWFPKGFDYKYRIGVLHPECPFCHNYITQKVKAGSRVVSVGLFGLGSKKIGKQWYCYTCKSYF